MSQTDIRPVILSDALKQVGPLPMIQRLERGIHHPVVERDLPSQVGSAIDFLCSDPFT